MLTLHDSGAYARFSPYGVTKHAFHHTAPTRSRTCASTGSSCFTNRVPDDRHARLRRHLGVVRGRDAPDPHRERARARPVRAAPARTRTGSATRAATASSCTTRPRSRSTLAAAERVGIELPRRVPRDDVRRGAPATCCPSISSRRRRGEHLRTARRREPDGEAPRSRVRDDRVPDGHEPERRSRARRGSSSSRTAASTSSPARSTSARARRPSTPRSSPTRSASRTTGSRWTTRTPTPPRSARAPSPRAGRSSAATPCASPRSGSRERILDIASKELEIDAERPRDRRTAR